MFTRATDCFFNLFVTGVDFMAHSQRIKQFAKAFFMFSLVPVVIAAVVLLAIVFDAQ